jgi:DNA-binding transcriptional LysR family regulator
VALAVSRSGLIAAIPTEFAAAVAEDMGLTVHEPPVATGNPEISMYWHSRHDRNGAHRWLRDRVRDATAIYRR